MKHYHCPVNGWDCPYFINEKELSGNKEYCLCGLSFENLNPYYECDDFAGSWGDVDDEYDYTDYTDDD